MCNYVYMCVTCVYMCSNTSLIRIYSSCTQIIDKNYTYTFNFNV